MKESQFKLASAVLLLIAVSIQTLAQTTVSIPDVNFKNKLLNNYPSVMTGNQLNISAAQNYPFDVILSYSGITDFTGLEYFTSTFKIDISYNNATSIPAITNSSLKYLYANNNLLTQLPNLSSLTSLLELQLSYNKLTSLPQLSALTSLSNLYASDNKLTALPSISNLTNLKILVIGNNPFTSLPDFSPNYNLLELHVHQSGISEIKGLASLTKLKKLYCWSNTISDLSALSGNTTLTALYAFSNKLSVLPFLKNKASLFAVEIANNQLTFEDLLPVSTINLSDFSYSPQDSIGVYTQVPTRLMHTLSLSMAEDANVTSSIYNWYKNNISIDTTNSNQKTVTASAQITHAGNYYVSITNPNLPLLTLTHRKWNVTLTTCVDLISYTLSVPLNECSSGATINSTVILDGGVAPYYYYLTPSNAQNSLTSSTGDFSQVAPGQYIYSVKDANGCGIDTNVTIQKPHKCDPVITPNGDPQMSSYFIEQSGATKIIDMEGKTILQLTAPAVWYGTKADGSFADAGYYVIIVNNKKVTNITVIR